MKDKLRLPIIILVLVLVLVGVPFVLVIKNKKTATLILLGSGQKNATLTEKLVTYNDSSGFNFDHSEGLTVKDVSGNDQGVYSSLEISSDRQAGKTTIKIIDSPYNSLSNYLVSKEVSGAGVSRDVTISSMPGRQIQFANPKRLATIAISEMVMYSVESPLDDSGYWNKVHNQIVSSFSVGTQETSIVDNDVGSDQTTSDEEEVIE